MENNSSKPSEDPFHDDENAGSPKAAPEPLDANVNVSSPESAPTLQYLGYKTLYVTGHGKEPVTVTLEVDQDLTPFAHSNDPDTKCFVTSSPLTPENNVQNMGRKLSEAVSVANENPFSNFASNKRRRQSDDDDDDVEKQPNKQAKHGLFGEIHKHKVTFIIPSPLQNNEGGEEVAIEADPPAAVNTQPGASSSKPRERVKILASAEPMWVAARRHRGMEQKCVLRADFHEQLLAQNVLPGQFLGADRLSRYFIKDGALPVALSDMITQQAREKTLLAIKLLKEEQLREKKLADYYDAVTKDLYQQEGSDQYPQAEALMVSLLSHYRGIEKRRLDALAKKELTRKANTPSDLANALCRESENYPVPSTSRGPRAPTKRARPGKSQSPAREVKKPTAAASSSKGRQAHGYTATKGRSKSPKASTSKQQAKGKSSQNASKGKGKAQAKGKSTKAAPPKKELSEGTLMVLEALGELTKQLKKWTVLWSLAQG